MPFGRGRHYSEEHHVQEAFPGARRQMPPYTEPGQTPPPDDPRPTPDQVARSYGRPVDAPDPPRVPGSAAEEICACLQALGRKLDELPDKIAHAVEQRLVTSKGATVRPPATCAQPVNSNDVDDQVLGMNLPASDANGVKRCVLKRVAQRPVVLKGLNWEFVVDASVKRPADPADQLLVHVKVDGRSVGTVLRGEDMPTGGKRTRAAYDSTSRPPAPGGIDQLAPSQIYLQEGQCVELIAERIAQPTGQTRIDYEISARWKGWEWTQAVDTQGIDGATGF